MTWPSGLPVANVRIARPTAAMADVVAFYRDALGLEILASFAGHDGFDGVIFALGGPRLQLELVRHASGAPTPTPTAEDLLVLYLPDEAAMRAVAGRLEGAGHLAVPSANPYWDARGAVTVCDPDGWRLVLVPEPFGAP